MSKLVDYAKDELKRIGMIDSGEPYNDWATKAILNLIELFASQTHSGFTAPYVINAFSRLAMFKPLSPLTGEDDEWNDIENGFKQNKRYSAVFKDKNGTAYNIEGKAFTDDGEVWYTCRDSKVNVTFPYVVPDKPEYVYRNKEVEDRVIAKEEIKNTPEIVDFMLNKSVTADSRMKLHKRLEKICELAIKALEHETVTEFADRCRECGAKKGKVSNYNYTIEELNTFLNGISLRLFSLRSAQYWKYSKETADNIFWLERLYEKVKDDIEHKDF